MIQYTLFNIPEWKYRLPQISIGLMQLLGGLLTEIINLILICSTTNVTDIVQNFIQFAVIADIDDMFARSLKNSFLLTLVKTSSLNFSEGKGFKQRKLAGNESICS